MADGIKHDLGQAGLAARWPGLRRGFLYVLAVGVSMALVVPLSTAQQRVSSTPAGAVDFVQDVQPILVKHCYSCHGPDEQSGGLRLDRKADAFRGGDSGPAIEPNSGAMSRLVRYVSGADPLVTMPPDGEPLTKRQIGVLQVWIDRGAAWPDDADTPWAAARRHWAYQPIQRPLPPAVKDFPWVGNPIDAFVLSKLQSEGLAPSPAAARATLLRRLYLDLIGLPPSPDEIDQFLADDRPQAYEGLVESLLASPHFGERWGRHWLDLARYADSDGYEDDLFRPDAWRYRDWVIRAVNEDMPLDQFTIEQLAGDLLPGAAYDQQVAAGFHRMTLLNRSGSRRNEEEYRVKTAKDRAGTTATVWLGLTIACAECHSHKYDPIPQSDYYRFYAIFNNLVDVDIPGPPLPSEYYERYERTRQAFEERQSAAKAQLAKYVEKILPEQLAIWEQNVDRRNLPSQVAEILAVARKDRNAQQTEELLAYFRTIDEEFVRLDAAVLKGGELSNNQPPPPSENAPSLRENTDTRKTHVQIRGNYQSNGDEVRPGTPEFLPSLGYRSNNDMNRLDLARWIVHPRNPLTARVAANHIWRHLFGRGLVTTPENFGVRGEPPSHPKLLDSLASELVESGWSRKDLIRLIVKSSTYRQSSRRRADLSGRDPENRWLSRQNRFRVEAEIVRDLGLAVSGLLNRTVGGPSVQPPLPASLMRGLELKNECFIRPSEAANRYRRGIYVNAQRTFTYPMFKAFDTADPNSPCTRRDRSNTPQQALSLMNDPVYVDFARGLGLRLIRECEEGRGARIEYAFRLCLTRRPSPRETAVLGDVYEAHRSTYAENPQVSQTLVAGAPVPDDVPLEDVAAWIGVVRTIINLDEFITRE